MTAVFRYVDPAGKREKLAFHFRPRRNMNGLTRRQLRQRFEQHISDFITYATSLGCSHFKRINGRLEAFAPIEWHL